MNNKMLLVAALGLGLLAGCAKKAAEPEAAAEAAGSETAAAPAEEGTEAAADTTAEAAAPEGDAAGEATP
jgi:hypothetical protein